MPNKGHEDQVALTKDEHALLSKIAARDGVSVDEAASELLSQALARRVRKRTGKSPAKVYPFKGK